MRPRRARSPRPDAASWCSGRTRAASGTGAAPGCSSHPGTGRTRAMPVRRRRPDRPAPRRGPAASAAHRPAERRSWPRPRPRWRATGRGDRVACASPRARAACRARRHGCPGRSSSVRRPASRRVPATRPAGVACGGRRFPCAIAGVHRTADPPRRARRGSAHPPRVPPRWGAWPSSRAIACPVATRPRAGRRTSRRRGARAARPGSPSAVGGCWGRRWRHSGPGAPARAGGRRRHAWPRRSPGSSVRGAARSRFPAASPSSRAGRRDPPERTRDAAGPAGRRGSGGAYGRAARSARVPRASLPLAPLPSAAFRTMRHLIPDIAPLAAPGERATAGAARLAGQVGLAAHGGVAAVYRFLRATLRHGCARAIRDHLAQRVYGWLASARL